MQRAQIAHCDGVAVYAGFEGAGVGGLREVADGVIHLDCLEEPDVPELAYRGVFFDYAFAVGLRNTTDTLTEACIRLHLCPRSAHRNIRFMRGPYWIKEQRGWRQLLPTNHASGDGWVDTRLTLGPDQDTILATRPYWTATETEEIAGEYAARLPFASVRSIGETAESRDLWVIETEPRDDRIFIMSSLQSAEFAGDTVLHVLDWLGTPTCRSTELLERFQFVVLPVPMPDGVAHGYSIMNARGRCPMFDFGPALRGEPCAEESAHLWCELVGHPPRLSLDVHVHPGDIVSPKLNNVLPEWYRDGAAAEVAERVGEAMLAQCPEWRLVPVPLDRPDFHMQDSLMVLMAKHLGSAAFCLQDYALTAEGTKPLLISILDAALEEICRDG